MCDLLAATLAVAEEESIEATEAPGSPMQGRTLCKPVSRALVSRGIVGEILNVRGPGILRELTIVAGSPPSILLSIDGGAERITFEDARTLSTYTSWLDAFESDNRYVLVLSGIRFYSSLRVNTDNRVDAIIRVEYNECSRDTGVAEEAGEDGG